MSWQRRAQAVEALLWNGGPAQEKPKWFLDALAARSIVELAGDTSCLNINAGTETQWLVRPGQWIVRWPKTGHFTYYSAGDFHAMFENAAAPADGDAQVVAIAVAMREAQRKYFKSRSRDDLIASKQLEKRFDDEILKRGA